MQAREPELLDRCERAREGRAVLGREADDHVAREVEARHVLARALDAARVGRQVVAAAHGLQHGVVARLQRDVQVRADARMRERLAEPLRSGG